MTEWLAKNAAKAIAIAVFILLIAAVLVVHSCRSAQTAHTETKLATGQAGAALQSGTDAANTVGNRMDADASTDRVTAENEATIRSADGASAPVAAPARDAGIAALCRRAAYKDTDRCKR